MDFYIRSFAFVGRDHIAVSSLYVNRPPQVAQLKPSVLYIYDLRRPQPQPRSVGTTEWLCSLLFPPLKSHTEVLAVKIRTECNTSISQPRNDLQLPFYNSVQERLYGIEIVVGNQHLLECYMVFCMLSSLMRAIAIATSANTRIDIPWNDWGPVAIINAPELHPTWDCTFTGMKFIERVPTDEMVDADTKILVAIYDFNQRDLRRSRRSTGNEVLAPISSQAFEEPIQADLPFHRQTYLDQYSMSGDAVMCAEDSVILVKVDFMRQCFPFSH